MLLDANVKLIHTTPDEFPTFVYKCPALVFAHNHVNSHISTTIYDLKSLSICYRVSGLKKDKDQLGFDIVKHYFAK